MYGKYADVAEPRGCWEQLDHNTQQKILEHTRRKIRRMLDKSSKNVSSKDLERPKLDYALIKQQWDAVPSSPPHSPPHKRRRLEDKEASRPPSSESEDEPQGDGDEIDGHGDEDLPVAHNYPKRDRRMVNASVSEIEHSDAFAEISPLDGEDNHSSSGSNYVPPSRDRTSLDRGEAPGGGAARGSSRSSISTAMASPADRQSCDEGTADGNGSHDEEDDARKDPDEGAGDQEAAGDEMGHYEVD
jgi:hypothetical protein